MIAVRSLSDVQIVLRNHDTQLNTLRSKDLDLTGRRVINAGDGVAQTDYVTLRQLPTGGGTSPSPADQNLAIVFAFGSVMPQGTLISAPYVPGEFRTGIPQWVRLVAMTAPTGGNLSCNILWQRQGAASGIPILTSDVILTAGMIGPIKVTNFISPVPQFDADDILLPTCENSASAGWVSIIVGVKRG